jgi:hypothetical protein
MKIVSKYKDYYDGIQSLAFDKFCVYNRDEEVVITDRPLGFDHTARELMGYKSLYPLKFDKRAQLDSLPFIILYNVMIGYCGKLIQAYKIDFNDGDKIFKTSLFYSYEELYDYLEKANEEYDIFGSTNKIEYQETRKYTKIKNLKFENKYLMEQDFSMWFHHFAAPVFFFPVGAYDTNRYPNNLSRLCESNKKIEVIINPVLKDLEFFKIKDPYSCYQELYQFIGGVLKQKEDYLDELADKEKAAISGIDPKYGFRIRPKE